MNKKWSILAVALVATIVGFLFESAGPIGSMIWPVAEGLPEPEGVPLAALMLMGVIEALAFGAGVTFLVFGWSWVKRVTINRANTVAVYLSIAWMLVNWVPHTALHMSNGHITQPSDYMALAGIEYGFHLTLIIAGCFLALFFLRALPMMAASSQARSGPAPETRSKPVA